MMKTPAKLTPAQTTVLRMIGDRGGVKGVQIRYVWVWLIGSQTVTRHINGLRRKGMVDIMAFPGGNGSASLTDDGRAFLSKIGSASE
jgi:DNA-binding MarR family transcriptional regulator